LTSTSKQLAKARRDAPNSMGFAGDREIVVRDRNDPSKELATIMVGPDTQISMRVVHARSRNSARAFLERLTWLRKKAQLRFQLWRQQVDPLASAQSSSVVREILQEIEATERLLSRVSQDTWRGHATRMRLPALCGNLPYFPAAP